MSNQSSNDQPNYASFGRALIELLNQRGWNSIPRREMTILLIDSAVKAGLVNVDLPPVTGS